MTLTDFQLAAIRRKGYEDAVMERHEPPEGAPNIALEAYEQGHQHGQKAYVRAQQRQADQ